MPCAADRSGFSANAAGPPLDRRVCCHHCGAWKDGLPNPVLKGDFFITKFYRNGFPYSTSDDRRMLEALSGYLNDEYVMNTDLVAWYQLSFVHHPRSEDWPAQPIVWHSFELMPRDFLDASPLEVSK